MSGRFWTTIYLVFILWPVPRYLESGPAPAEAALVAAGIAAFAVLYLRVMWTALARPHENATPVALALLWVVTALLAFPLRELWLFASLFLLISALAASLETRAFTASVGVTFAGTLAVLPLLGLPLSEFWWIPTQALLFAGAMGNFLSLRRANLALTRARVRAERLAIDNERLRFARDLHDILGHSLSVMTMKSQLAARLVPADPARARAEMGEVEELSRQALSEVREAVAGYRALSLTEELLNARRALEAAGVRLEVVTDPIPPGAASLFAWVVREGATNVVRHSHAATCQVRFGVDAAHAYVEMTDDGRGPATSAEGRGLRGLTERMQAVGGTLYGSPAPGGGFRLRARLPLEECV
ncbi:sensor histidine kinase [Sphaerisporangium sp. TRM90804]|uniref:sensor histidine kinase n=1 Tax=Sphaerisporangium sp. TRM90804 TaxID=3031113 RepID=UPI0024479CE0|nr:sensor histidine kinase [Sphaerisporangium sp. TRM90804]MDH2427240.1 sensor histidine kinase [Sphaerisporangium sp. TRM90804]